MNRKQCSRNPRKQTKFKDSYDEEYAWEDFEEVQSIRKKSRKQKRNNALKQNW
tara:strand:+ start:1442 stop:1600 length:159 start_codon:yes stop_codon:yes gene_type:complete